MARLLHTNEANVLGKSVKGFPLILTDDGHVNWWTLDYFIYLYAAGTAPTSINTYATHLVDLHSQLEVDQKKVSEMTDPYLSAYNESLVSRGTSANYRRQMISSGLSYQMWLEKTQKTHGVIGEGPGFAIQVKHTRNGIVHRLTKKPRGYRGRKNQSPRQEWIDVIKAHGPLAPCLAIRFELMIDWCKTCGLRAKEVCLLRLAQLPDRLAVQKALEHEYNVAIYLVDTKGSNPATIEASPLLVKRTLDWIDIERESLVHSRSVDSPQSNTSPYIFISSQTGDALNPRAFSNQIRAAFRRAVSEGKLGSSERVWLHGLRHFMINHELDERKRAGQRNSEEIVRHKSRHGSINAMSPYVATGHEA